MHSLVKQLLVRLGIENFIRLRVIQNNEAEYVNFWSQQDMAKNKIILDVELIKLSSRKDIGCEASDKTNISSIIFERNYPKFNDFFMFNIKHNCFASLSGKSRSLLVSKLTRCIDLSYIYRCKATKISGNFNVLSLSDKNKSQELQELGLNPPEFKQLRLISIIGTNKEIASIFGLSPRTIEKSISTLGKKLGIGNKIELQLFAKFFTSELDEPYEYLQLADKLRESLTLRLNNYCLINENLNNLNS